jgi:ribosomal protein L7/L12
MNFYTRVLTKLGVGEALKLTVSVEYKLDGGVPKQKIDDVKSALRELGLNDRLEER